MSSFYTTEHHMYIVLVLVNSASWIFFLNSKEILHISKTVYCTSYSMIVELTNVIVQNTLLSTQSKSIIVLYLFPIKIHYFILNVDLLKMANHMIYVSKPPLVDGHQFAIKHWMIFNLTLKILPHKKPIRSLKKNEFLIVIYSNHIINETT